MPRPLVCHLDFAELSDDPSDKVLIFSRRFADTQIKLIVATLLLEYDFKFEEGQGRPKSLLTQSQHMPNPNIEVLFKKRNV